MTKEVEKTEYTDNEIYDGMYKHLQDVYNHTKNWACDGTLKLTKRYIRKYASDELQFLRVLTYIERHGGYCDCEVVINCPHQMH